MLLYLWLILAMFISININFENNTFSNINTLIEKIEDVLLRVI